MFEFVISSFFIALYVLDMFGCLFFFFFFFFFLILYVKFKK